MGKELSKRFVLQLSPKGEKIKVQGQEIETRDVEIAMLTSLFDLAASNQKSFRAANECLDCVGQIEGLADGDTEILLTQQDIDYLKVGYEKSADQRPTAWNRCRNLMAQLADPKEKTEETKSA